MKYDLLKYFAKFTLLVSQVQIAILAILPSSLYLFPKSKLLFGYFAKLPISLQPLDCLSELQAAPHKSNLLRAVQWLKF
jgi:hypothetical protein